MLESTLEIQEQFVCVELPCQENMSFSELINFEGQLDESVKSVDEPKNKEADAW